MQSYMTLQFEGFDPSPSSIQTHSLYTDARTLHRINVLYNYIDNMCVVCV